MEGTNFGEIVVRRTIEKGTKIIEEKAKPMDWAGRKFKESQQRKLKKIGDVELTSGKGTGRILLNSLKVTKIPDAKGRYLVTGKGTSVTMSS